MSATTLIAPGGVYAADTGSCKLPPPEFIVRIQQHTRRDCLRCCVAMITGATYEQTPDFVAGEGSWSARLREWLCERGAGLLLVGHDISEVPRGTAHIAIGRAHSGRMHAVVVTDRVIDPGMIDPPLGFEPKHRLVILPLVAEPDICAEYASSSV